MTNFPQFEDFISACITRIDTLFNNPEHYGYVENFVNKDSRVSRHNPVIKSMLLDMAMTLCGEHFDQLQLQDMIDEEGKLKEEGIEFLAQKAVPLFTAASDQFLSNRYRDKLISKNGYILEMPADTAKVKAPELAHRKAIFKALGFPEHGIDNHIRLFTLGDGQDHAHSTYGLVLNTHIGNAEEQCQVYNLFGAGLQGLHRRAHGNGQFDGATNDVFHAARKLRAAGYAKKLNRCNDPAQKAQITRQMKKEGFESFNAGGQIFVYNDAANEALRQRSLAKLGDEYIQLVANICERLNTLNGEGVADIENHELRNYKVDGFTAGVSGNAMHYIVSAQIYSLSTTCKLMRPEQLQEAEEICIDHLIGVYSQSLHHSYPETKLGFEIGLQLSKEQGFPNNMKLSKERIIEIVRECSDRVFEDIGQHVSGEVAAQKVAPVRMLPTLDG